MTEYKIADTVLLKKQKDLLRLLKHVHQPTFYNEIRDLAISFDLSDLNQWTRSEYPEQLLNYYKEGMLSLDDIFSVYDPNHVKQAEALFKVFFYARTYHVFYMAAAWARINVNPGMFVYSLSVAIVHCKHTIDVILPPIYETLPHYYFSDKVISYAHKEKQICCYGEELKKHVVNAEYTDSDITYLTEDIGFNSYYYYKNVYMPYWLEEKCMSYDGTNRGEWFQYYHNQILARYYLERLSNGKGRIPQLDYKDLTKSTFNPKLTYPNGQPFAKRENLCCSIKVEDYERRLRDAVDLGFTFTPEGKIVNLLDAKGFEMLGRMVECDPESPHNQYHGNIQVFTRLSKEPSTLSHFETSLRDPKFYEIYKKLLNHFHVRLSKLQPYNAEDLLFDGVKVNGIDIDRLETYFNEHYADLANAVTVTEKEFLNDTFHVYAKQMRLNHKPFSYRITVSSTDSKDAMVKVYLGPKYDEHGNEINIKNNYMNFFELDRFKCSLREGSNTIQRSSDDIMYFSQDRVTVKTFAEQIENGLNGKDHYKAYPYYKFYTFPQRLMLPKGDTAGKPFKLLVVVCKYHAPENDSFADFLVDTQYSMNYPFDRPIKVEDHFWVPNFYTKDVHIHHIH